MWLYTRYRILLKPNLNELKDEIIPDPDYLADSPGSLLAAGFAGYNIMADYLAVIIAIPPYRYNL